MKTYLLKTVCTCGRGEKAVALEYRVVSTKRDMRRRFCRENEENIIEDMAALFHFISKHNMKIKSDRIIAPNGKAACAFQRELEYLKRKA